MNYTGLVVGIVKGKEGKSHGIIITCLRNCIIETVWYLYVQLVPRCWLPNDKTIKFVGMLGVTEINMQGIIPRNCWRRNPIKSLLLGKLCGGSGSSCKNVIAKITIGKDYNNMCSKCTAQRWESIIDVHRASNITSLFESTWPILSIVLSIYWLS